MALYMNHTDSHHMAKFVQDVAEVITFKNVPELQQKSSRNSNKEKCRAAHNMHQDAEQTKMSAKNVDMVR